MNEWTVVLNAGGYLGESDSLRWEQVSGVEQHEAASLAKDQACESTGEEEWVAICMVPGHVGDQLRWADV